MASDLTPYLGNKICRWLGGEAMPTAPTDIYMALYNGNPKAAGTEVTTTLFPSGARLPIDWTVPAAGTDMELVNAADVDFGEAEAPATITHVAIFDAATSGNMLASKILNAPISAIVDTAIKFNAGDVKFVIGSEA